MQSARCRARRYGVPAGSRRVAPGYETHSTDTRPGDPAQGLRGRPSAYDERGVGREGTAFLPASVARLPATELTAPMCATEVQRKAFAAELPHAVSAAPGAKVRRSSGQPSRGSRLRNAQHRYSPRRSSARPSRQSFGMQSAWRRGARVRRSCRHPSRSTRRRNTQHRYSPRRSSARPSRQSFGMQSARCRTRGYGVPAGIRRAAPGYGAHRTDTRHGDPSQGRFGMQSARRRAPR
jgi:hypothetical protein